MLKNVQQKFYFGVIMTQVLEFIFSFLDMYKWLKGLWNWNG